jgi:HEAT repeat protein
VEPEEAFVYKEGYVWYRVIFGKVQHFVIYMPDLKLEYRKRRNLVKLQPWIDELSHEEHMGIFTRGFGSKGMMLKEALKNEMVIAERESRSAESQKQKSNTVCYELMRAKRKYERNDMSKEEYVALLHRGLKSPNVQTLIFASGCLEKLGDKSSIPVLIEFLRANLYRTTFGEVFVCLRWLIGRDDLLVGSDRIHTSRNIRERMKALAELERLCEEYVATSTIEWYGNIALAVNNKDSEVRSNAIRILFESRDVAAIPYILACLDDRGHNPIAYTSTMEALSEFGDASDIPELRNMLKNQSMGVRHAAAMALHRLGDDSGVPIVIEALKSHDMDVQSRAVIVLSDIAKEDFCGGRSLRHFSAHERQQIIERCLNWWKADRDLVSTK